MGCDIHVQIEVQQPDGHWVNYPYTEEAYHYDLDAGNPNVYLEQQRAVVEDFRATGGVVFPQQFTGRNYDLFGILANVRNGSGFAGCDTGDAWPSIAPDRGLPEGMGRPSGDVRYPGEDGEDEPYLGDHSFTWVTLDELEAFDWEGTVVNQRGVVSAEVYESLQPGEAPREWSGGVSGPGVYVYMPDRYEQVKQAGELAKQPYVKITWPQTAASATGHWWRKVGPVLKTIAAGRPLRLVLGFDS